MLSSSLSSSGGRIFLKKIMKYYYRLMLCIGLVLSGVQGGHGLVCATGETHSAQQESKVRQGAVHALVIYARFRDENRGNASVPAFAGNIFTPTRAGSLTHFYLEMSRGQFTLSGEVLPRWYAAWQPAEAYLAAAGEPVGRFGSFVEEVLQAVDEDVDLGLYDNDGADGIPNSGDDDGEVDFIFVNTLTAPKGFIVGMATGIAQLGLPEGFTSKDPAINGGFIRIRSDGDRKGPGGVLQRGHTYAMAVGSMAHEYGHVLGLPDLYDTGFSRTNQDERGPADDSAGIGYWGLMGHGTRGWNEVDGPNPFCAWSLEQLGWLGVGNEKLVTVEKNFEDLVFAAVAEGGEIYKVPTGNPDVYYLVEHRRPGSSYYERSLPAGGLLIWRIDRAQPGNDDEEKKLVDLVCADGLYLDAGFPEGLIAHPDLGRDNLDFWAHDTAYRMAHNGNLGDATDVFDGVGATDFWVASNPAAPSGLRIADIRRRGDDMVADIYIDDPHRAGFTQESETWQGTIKVVGDLFIRSNTELILAPGTRVEVGRDLRRSGRDPERCELVVQGRLLSGVPPRREKVLITSAAVAPRAGDWQGIVLGISGQIDMQNTVIEYAQNGLWGEKLMHPQRLVDTTIRKVGGNGICLRDIQAEVDLTRMEISDADSSGIRVFGQGALKVRESRFLANRNSGLERAGGRLDCRASEFADNGLGTVEGANLILGEGASGKVVGNRFSGGVGIYCVGNRDVVIQENRLVENRIGIISSSARPRIESNEFFGNELALQIAGFSAPIFIALNVVEESDRLVDNQAVVEVVARNNWWGGVDVAQIGAGISGEVVWQPFLNFDPRQPVGFSLRQNFPNPFNGSTRIDYTIGIEVPIVAGETDMVLEVRSFTGGLVRRLVQQAAAPGFYSAIWDGRSERGEPAASGVYYYQLRIGPIVRYKRLVLIK